ncbi:MAG: DNA cytosine methyltransferase [Pseudomonadota bacterium]
MEEAVLQAKANRLKAGKSPRVLDLFSGCGGISLGFQSAGYEITAALEADPSAARSHGMNFHGGDERFCQPMDITSTDAETLCRHLSLGKPGKAFDVIVGGPPCQAFARVGRSKLRDVADHPEAFRHDPRARLYSEYLEFVSDCAPLAVVMENVPDMLNHGGHNLAEEICEVLDARGYDCSYTLLNAAFFGVPQMRERMFLVAVSKVLRTDFVFPEPTHWVDLPRGYQGSRSVALKLLGDLFARDEQKWFAQLQASKPDLERAITAHEAIGDLPQIHARRDLKSGSLKRGTRRLDIGLKYAKPENLGSYAHLMREWPGFEGSAEIHDHVIRYLPRDYKLFARLKPGNQYPEAYAMAEKMFDEALKKLETKNARPLEGSEEWNQLKTSIVPPYDPGKFPNKWRKMERDKPARTLLAHLGKDGYSHIHYDSRQARTISVREAARLQSFPDGFTFSGTMNPAFRQIGNAVPPLMAKAIAVPLLKALTQQSVLEIREAS